MVLRIFGSCLIVALSLGIARPAAADGTAQTLPFTQSWTVTTQISANDNWSGVPGIVGYNGTGMGTSGTADPQTLLGVGTESLQVLANQPATTITNGGVAEFDALANPSVAFQGSGTAGAPNLVITIVTTGLTNITVAYLLRDLDAVDDAAQRVALQYRVGTTGNYTNLPAGYVADATAAGGATLTTPVSVVLPAACENQPLVEIRIITANAPSNDEWVGVDDISISSVPANCGNGTPDAGEACDTGAANGTTPCGCTRSCQLVANGVTCGAAATLPCDANDTCNGTGTCVANVAANTVICHPSMGTCDPAEHCDGTTTVCPPDLLATSGTACRPMAGVCDVADTCNGTSAACTDVFAANGTPCDDGMMCNGSEMCMTGACMHVSPPSCADTNACTTDACVEATPMCTHTLRPAPACCNVAADCDDGDACTTNACTTAGGVCTFDPISDCCTTVAQCDDGDACTTDACDATAHTCSHTPSCIDGGGSDAGGATDAGRDAGATEAGMRDANSGTDAGHTTPRPAGCACAATGTGSETGALWALGLLGLVVGRRRLSSR
jgi:MYXO-CTERM domain-containing protein